MIKTLRSAIRAYRATSLRCTLISLAKAGFTESAAKRLLWTHLNK